MAPRALDPAPSPHDDDEHLPIERLSMPSEDVSDLRDVVDAINKLCDTMKTSCDDRREERCDLREADDESIEPVEVAIEKVETYVPEKCTDRIEDVESVASESENYIEEIETIPSRAVEEDPVTIRSDQIEELETVVSDSELVTAEPMQYEPTSEMYFTASSEVSLLSDMDLQERLGLSDDSDIRRDDRNGVMAGHVAAMREHFESMTRTNTPCPDLLRSSSPSYEVFRTVTNSPDN